ncbi:LPXTG cell wall anchor domain-containing protein, partial [Streptococcus mitis]|nr:LPXTG cell wall anchor domain-containing protein [Streptococcus mitis]
DADKNEPKAKEQTVKVGDAPKAEDSIANFKDLPSGTTAKFKEPVDTTTPGEKTPVVVVTYPDGSKDEVPVKVTVKDPRSDADKNEPKAKEQTVKVGDAPKAEDSIANFKDLPSGTTAKFKEPVDTKTPGDKTPVVVVTYPDGSKDEVPVKVTVKDPRSDADKNEPKAKEQTVKVGDAPKAEDSIANFKDLPSGTTAKFKEPVDTTTPGEKTPVVVVTYPDGSKDEVPVKVTVKDPRSDADKNEPKAKEQTVKVGDAPKAEDSIANFKDLPSGTTAKFKEPVDTTTPGEKTPVVVVTYPDGSKDEVPVKVTVKDSSVLTQQEITADPGTAKASKDGKTSDESAPKLATKDPAITPVVNPSTKKVGAKELPNTGTEKSNASLGLVLLTAVTGGLLFAKKRKEEE